MYTAVGMAIREHNNDLAKQLIQHPDCDVNAANSDGYTALMLASDAGQLACVTALLNAHDASTTHDDGAHDAADLIASSAQYRGCDVNVVPVERVQ